MTPLDEVRKLRRALAAVVQAVDRHAEKGHVLPDDVTEAVAEARAVMATEKQSVALKAHLNALGMARLLGEAALHVDEDTREAIGVALFDAEDIYPVRVTQTIHRFDIEPLETA